MSAKHILVVDDEKHFRTALFEVLTRQGHAVDLAENGLEALNKFNEENYDLVITDIKMPQKDGLVFLEEAKAFKPEIPIILITAYGTVDIAVKAMRLGAFDFILKPFSFEIIEASLKRIWDQKKNNSLVAMANLEDKKLKRPIITKSPKMKRLLEMAKMVASSPTTVLLQGASGTGKELVARYLHEYSPRAEGPFIAINCASLPENLLESELFGHEKGSFTGAVSNKQGKFELADGGTILLDEISEMDLALQAKLLRVLQENEVDRVGGKEPIEIDARVIATTNRNLKAWVDKGSFRADLYYRLNVIPLYLPSLKERDDDISILAKFFVEKYARENKKEINGLEAEALEILNNYNWPGNIRELENIIARSVLLSTDSIIKASDLLFDEDDFMRVLEKGPIFTEIKNMSAEKETEITTKTNKLNQSAKLEDNKEIEPEPKLMTIGEMERLLIYKALDETTGNRTHAAKILGISVRTLRNKLANYREETST